MMVVKQNACHKLSLCCTNIVVSVFIKSVTICLLDNLNHVRAVVQHFFSRCGKFVWVEECTSIIAWDIGDLQAERPAKTGWVP